jgi:hypothetical protein
MEQRALRGNPTAGLVLEHLVEKVKALVVNNFSGDEVTQVLAWVVRPVDLAEVLVLADSRPCLIIRFPERPEDFIDLILLILTLEEGLFGCKLSEDAAGRPDVDGCCVLIEAEQQLWGPVPKCHNIFRIGLDRNREGPSQSKVSKLDFIVGCATQQDVGWLEISVDDALRVTNLDARQDLEHVRLDLGR